MTFIRKEMEQLQSMTFPCVNECGSVLEYADYHHHVNNCGEEKILKKIESKSKPAETIIDEYKLKIKCLDNETLIMVIEDNTKISDIMDFIHSRKGIKPVHQYIHFNGKLLKKEGTVKDYKMQSNCKANPNALYKLSMQML